MHKQKAGGAIYQDAGKKRWGGRRSGLVEEEICPVMSANEDCGGAVTLHLAATWEPRKGAARDGPVCACSDNELGR